MNRLESWVAGVDEVGRGPLAGPVYAAAVILPQHYRLSGLKDSKLLGARQREDLSLSIKEQAVCWAVAFAEVQEIDVLNILQASLLAMQRAVGALKVKPTLAIVDGNRAPNLDCRIRTIVDGDASEPAIAAAAILAKVQRDELMQRLDAQYPQYGLGQNKGYPTRYHLDALRQYGPSPIHRSSFAPVRRALVNTV